MTRILESLHDWERRGSHTPKSLTAAWNRGQENTPKGTLPLPWLLSSPGLWGLLHPQPRSPGPRNMVSGRGLLKPRGGQGQAPVVEGTNESITNEWATCHTHSSQKGEGGGEKALLRENTQPRPERMVFRPLRHPAANRNTHDPTSGRKCGNSHLL